MLRAMIMQGIMGSGKSTHWEREVIDLHTLCSADTYDGLYGPNGEFHFELLGKAHGKSVKDAIYAAQTGLNGTIVVDNTNITVAELAPYVAIFSAYEIPITVVTVLCEPSKAAARNVHGVPESRVIMAASLLARELEAWPQHWQYIPGFTHTIIDNN